MGLNAISTKRGDTWNGSVYIISLSNLTLSTLVPLDLTGASILCQLKHKATDDEASLEFSTALSTISVSGNPLSGIFYIDAQIIDIPADRYVYDIQLTLNTGEVITPIMDYFSVLQDVSR